MITLFFSCPVRWLARNDFTSCAHDGDRETSWSFPEGTNNETPKREFQCNVAGVAMLAPAILFLFLVQSFLRKQRGVYTSKAFFFSVRKMTKYFGILGMCKNRMAFLFIAASKQFSPKVMPSLPPQTQKQLTSTCWPYCVFSFEVVHIKSADSMLCNGGILLYSRASHITTPFIHICFLKFLDFLNDFGTKRCKK